MQPESVDPELHLTGDFSVYMMPLKIHYLSIVIYIPAVSLHAHGDKPLKSTPTLFVHTTSSTLYSHFLSHPTVLAQQQNTLSSEAKSITIPCAGQLCHQKQWFDYCQSAKGIKSSNILFKTVPEIIFNL